MRPYGRISTHMPFGFEVRGGISDERLVSVDAKLKCGRGWAWGQFPAYVCWRSGESAASPKREKYSKTPFRRLSQNCGRRDLLDPPYGGIFEPRDGEL